jgi:hypothetical protein
MPPPPSSTSKFPLPSPASPNWLRFAQLPRPHFCPLTSVLYRPWLINGANTIPSDPDTVIPVRSDAVRRLGSSARHLWHNAITGTLRTQLAKIGSPLPTCALPLPQVASTMRMWIRRQTVMKMSISRVPAAGAVCENEYPGFDKVIQEPVPWGNCELDCEWQT